MAKNLLVQLEGGDRRSLGRADEIAGLVSKKPRLFAALFKGLWSEDALVRMRAADAAEKVTRTKRELLQPYKKEFLGLMAEAEQQEVRWHLALMAPRLALSAKEQQLVIALLQEYLEDCSAIVRTHSLQGLADLAETDPSIRPIVMEILRESVRSGTAAMRARSRKLLKEMESL
jgi:HEAT repeat protein